MWEWRFRDSAPEWEPATEWDLVLGVVPQRRRPGMRRRSFWSGTVAVENTRSVWPGSLAARRERGKGEPISRGVRTESAGTPFVSPVA